MLSRFKGALLSWLVAALSTWLLPNLIINVMIEATYFPSERRAHLYETINVLALIGLVANLTLAVFHSRKSRRTQVRRNALELAAVSVLLLTYCWFWDLIHRPT